MSADKVPAPQADPAGSRGVGRRIESLDPSGVPLKRPAEQSDPAAARGVVRANLEDVGGVARIPAPQAPSLRSAGG